MTHDRDGLAYTEPDALLHRVAGFAPSPDRQRPGWTDPRVIVAECGRLVAMIGHPKHRPLALTNCPGCF